MTPERSAQIEDLYHRALELEESQRAAFLQDACGGDRALQDEVGRLLAEEPAASFMEEPAFQEAATDPLNDAHTQLGPGAQLGSYRIEALIGAGGMGDVFCAVDTRLGRKVAIKVSAQQFTRRFDREARVISALNHPHICTLYDVGPNYFVMELVEGENLAIRLKKGPLPMQLVLRYGEQIADALAAAHAQGITHRDLKPANIMVTKSGVKVLDFGLAKITRPVGAPKQSESTALTASQAVMGTLGYMAPEQLEGQDCDARSDIFSLGLVLYEMATGRKVFSGDSQAALIADVMRCQPAPMESVPEKFTHVVERSLARDPDDRWQTAKDVKAELSWAGKGEAAAQGVPAQEQRGALRRWRIPALASGGIIFAALAVLALNAFMDTRSRADPGPKLSRAFRLTNTPEEEFGPAISPDGKWVAYYSTVRGPTDVWVKFLDSGATLNLTASLNLELPARTNIGGLAISPDGTTIAFNARPDPTFATYDTWVIPAPIGGVPRKLLQVLLGMQWSPDGKQVVAIRPGSSNGDALVLANADGTNPRDLIVPQGGRHVHWPAWARDGKYIYFIYTFEPWNAGPSEIYRVSSSGGIPEPAVESVRRAVYPVPLPGGGLVYSGNPDNNELGLWWQPAGGESRSLTTGVGEHAEARLSADGRKLVSTLFDIRQSLVSLPVPGGVGGMRQITDGRDGDLDPSFDPRGDRIVFSSLRSGHRNLWLARSDGSQPSPLTTGEATDERPSFSHDGQQIAFVSDRGGQRGIWVIGAEGGAPKFLGAALALGALTWSRDGKRILYSRPGADLLQLASISTADGKIESFPTPAAADAPAWSPTADIVAYLEPVTLPALGPSSEPVSRLWLKFVDAQGRPLFPNFPKQVQFSNGFLAWAPDGRRVAAVSLPANGVASVWIAEPEGREPFKKLADLPPKMRPHGITWTRDASAVILANREAISDIVLFDVTR